MAHAIVFPLFYYQISLNVLNYGMTVAFLAAKKNPNHPDSLNRFIKNNLLSFGISVINVMLRL